MKKAFKRWYRGYKERRRFKSLLGPKIGSGCSRNVYVMKGDPMRVVKVINPDYWDWDGKANVIEYEIWNAVEDTQYEKHFAKCYEISQCGTYLVQERVHGVGATRVKGIKLPEFVADLHDNNVGLRDGKPVIIDYASLTIKGKKNSW